MLVVLYFYQIGYRPLEIASLFLFYEFFGIITILAGGWLGARIGLNRVLNFGLILQVLALTMLLVPSNMLGLFWVMVAPAFSGIAKDLNKTSAKSSVKLFVEDGGTARLFRWVAALTGSKNAMKGLGYFAGGLLLALLDFRGAVLVLLAPLVLAILASLALLKKDLGKTQPKANFDEIFSRKQALNWLSAARFFLSQPETFGL
jgi:Major Facilitator Superfamily.